MSIGRNRATCRLCPNTAKGRITIQSCAICGGRICERHTRWADGGWMCTRCERELQRRLSLANEQRRLDREKDREEGKERRPVARTEIEPEMSITFERWADFNKYDKASRTYDEVV